MAEKIKNVEEKSRELAENISAWKQKATDSKKRLEETVRQKKMLSGEALTFKENLKSVEKDNEYLNNIIQITLAKLQAARAQDAKSPHSILGKGTSPENLKDAVSMNTSGTSEPGVLKTRSEDSMQTVVMTEDCNPEGRKKKMQGHHAASGSVKAAEEARFQRRKKKVRWFDETCGQRNMGTEGKVDVKGCELVGKQQLLAAEERAKLAEKETKQHKRRLEECHGQMREAEITLGLQVILAEKEAQDNWIRARELERENAEWRREVAHMKQRLDAICRERQAEEYMRQQAEEAQVYGNERVPYPISAAPCRFYPSEYPPAPFLGYRPPPPSPPWCSPGPYQTPLSPLFGPGAAPVQPGSSRQPEAALEAQVTLGVGGPHPFTGPACMACLISSPSSPSGPPAPGPPLCPVQPRPPAPPAPLGSLKEKPAHIIFSSEWSLDLPQLMISYANT
ncbi:transport and Golgi organization protein 1 homolog [Vicugna pacos]|uniref:Transport and Golgi organization protein 1 homolog n=1 Tax=Vicugna pacos TaxID=30538 RepID=A0ABM5BDK6_VICPA